MKKILVSTRGIQEANELIIQLQKALPGVMSQSWFQYRIPMKEKIEFLKELAIARTGLWQIVVKEYPECIGKSVTVDSVQVVYEADEIPEEAK
jgi:hypothetical protein